MPGTSCTFKENLIVTSQGHALSLRRGYLSNLSMMFMCKAEYQVPVLSWAFWMLPLYKITENALLLMEAHGQFGDRFKA